MVTMEYRNVIDYGTSTSSYINYDCFSAASTASTVGGRWAIHQPGTITASTASTESIIYGIDGRVFSNGVWRETGCAWESTWGSAICGSVTNPSTYAYRTIVETPQERLRRIIQQRHAPGVVVIESKRPMSRTPDIREQRARETLSRLIGQERFSRFLKQGFISAKNKKSGKIYQIFPGSGITKVFENGNLTARLCVVLQGNFPPTDSLIVRYLLALNDEDKLWSLAIKHSISNYSKTVPLVDSRSLTEIYKDLQKVA